MREIQNRVLSTKEKQKRDRKEKLEKGKAVAREAKRTWEVGNKVGLSVRGDEEEVIEEIGRLKANRGKVDGIGGVRDRKRVSILVWNFSVVFYCEALFVFRGMGILSWNISGLGSEVKKASVKRNCRLVKANVCFLQETKLELINIDVVRKLWGMIIVSLGLWQLKVDRVGC
ncbi:hypothetical protein E1A91_A02G182300v1 [Gossypium mustelinum]|uniref:Uncharacterized protein n=1 Tax=Gossypium mustelinum TaxID=34275 RepID=A0A5D3A6Z4_GOSMU|nr:hypothetical protein E1A91_A02G182300v1 [Gossypium mustelinum]